ncbi:unnamed protein product [Calypogeia fissa]
MLSDILMWEELHPKGVAPIGRGYHTFTAFGIHVLLFGGKGDKGIISSDDAYISFGASLGLSTMLRPICGWHQGSVEQLLYQGPITLQPWLKMTLFSCVVDAMGLKDCVTFAFSRPHPKPAWERDKHGLEVSSLQQMVDSLKAEVNSLKASIDIKDLLESELRAGKAALQQNIQLLQNQYHLVFVR